MPLSPSDLSALSRLLDEAMALEPPQREAWLAGLDASHAPLAPELRRMLATDLASDGFLATGPTIEAADDPSKATAGDAVGPYRLLREIGQGGMGTVWLAERADGTLKRQVALKLPRLAWGAGLADRMARERDIGALLAHPNIARLYDAGVDAKGRPFLALEYIDGVPLDLWCAEPGRTVRPRLQLFLQIARAVAYAHGRLVVHRDLKPSNVLVTADGQAHLLDFGIAKLLDEAGGGQDLTREQGRVLTPRYASPEQIEGGTITVASDVYSLGVLLYEMLAGRSPYAPERKTAAAVEAAILAGDLPKASAAAPPEAARPLRGEIDAILAKALRRDPSQRYATADAFADDVARHLEGRRIVAVADSLLYRTRKLLRRHRAAFGSAAAIALTLLGGTAFSVVQARRASDSAERARIVQEFVVDVFRVNVPSSSESAELRQLPAEMLLQRGAGLIRSKFAGRPDLQAELYGVVAGIYADMGLHDKGAEFAGKRVETLAAFDAPTATRAAALLVLARELAESDLLPDAESRAGRALELSADDDAGRVSALVLLARIHNLQVRREEADARLAEAERLLERDAGLPASIRIDAVAERAAWMMSGNAMLRGITLYEDAIRRALALEGELSPRASRLRIDLAYELATRRRAEEAKVQGAAAFAVMRRVAGPDDITTGVLEAGLASYLFAHNGLPYDEAVRTLERVQRMADRSPTPVPERIRASLAFQRGRVDLGYGKVEAAYQRMAPAFEALRPGARGPAAVYALVAPFASVTMQTGRHATSTPLMREWLALDRLPDRINSPRSFQGFMDAARNDIMQGRFDEAEATLDAMPPPAVDRGVLAWRLRNDVKTVRAQLELDRGDLDAAILELPAHEGIAPRLVRGAAECGKQHADEGLALLRHSLESLPVERYAYAPDVARWRTVAGLCALQAGRRDEAAALATQAREAFAQQPGVSPYYKALLPELERRLATR